MHYPCFPSSAEPAPIQGVSSGNPKVLDVESQWHHADCFCFFFVCFVEYKEVESKLKVVLVQLPKNSYSLSG